MWCLSSLPMTSRQYISSEDSNFSLYARGCPNFPSMVWHLPQWHLHYYIRCLQCHTPWGKFIWTNIYRNNRADHTKPHCISPTFTPLLIHISPALLVILLLFTLSYFYVYYLSFYIYYLKHQVVLYSYIRLVFDSGH